MMRWDVIASLINGNGYKRVAEIGVCKGHTAIGVLEACELDVYYAIDYRYHYAFFAKLTERYYPALKLYQMTSTEAAVVLPDDLDLVFVDAWHDAASVSRDIRLWLPKLRVGGILCGHDYDNLKWQDVKATVDRLLGQENIMLADVKGCKIWIYYKADEAGSLTS